MQIYQVGRESSLLAEVKAGRKTVEIRLNRGKFQDFNVGDILEIREDFYENGKIVNSLENQVKAEIISIEKHSTFKETLESVGFKNAVPNVQNIDEAIAVC